VKLQSVLIEIKDAVASVRLNRPKAHNGMDFDMLDAVLAAARSLRNKRELRAAILPGIGPLLSAGLDVKVHRYAGLTNVVGRTA